MTNNDILRRLRFAFDFSDQQAAELFSLDPNTSVPMSREQFLRRVVKEEDNDFIECSDLELSAFLDGLIVMKRGLKEPGNAAPRKPSTVDRLSKNDVLKKLRIAMTLQEQDMLETLKLGGSELSKAELSALFRNPQHKHFRTCGNQVLRNFIKGLTHKLRD